MLPGEVEMCEQVHYGQSTMLAVKLILDMHGIWYKLNGFALLCVRNFESNAQHTLNSCYKGVV